jgi:hypothetical protein
VFLEQRITTLEAKLDKILGLLESRQVDSRDSEIKNLYSVSIPSYCVSNHAQLVNTLIESQQQIMIQVTELSKRALAE